MPQMRNESHNLYFVEKILKGCQSFLSQTTGRSRQWCDGDAFGDLRIVLVAKPVTPPWQYITNTLVVRFAVELTLIRSYSKAPIEFSFIWV